MEDKKRNKGKQGGGRPSKFSMNSIQSVHSRDGRGMWWGMRIAECRECERAMMLNHG